jgi:DNA polymerase-3 subunit beta
MEVEFVRSSMAGQFAIAASVAPKNSPKDVLKYVKLVANRDGVFLFATDSENGIRIKVNGILSASPGECLLPVDRMTLILRESTDETLKVSTLGDTIHVRGRSRSTRFRPSRRASSPRSSSRRRKRRSK